jgi:predicted RNase H-like HicB family nuclease
MTIETSPVLSSLPSQMSYMVSVEQKSSEHWSAKVLGWGDCHAEAESREAAVSQVKQALNDRLSRMDLIVLEIPIPASEHSWMKYAGMFENDPLFDEVLDEIAEYRHQLDSSRAELVDEQ